MNNALKFLAGRFWGKYKEPIKIMRMAIGRLLLTTTLCT